MGEFITVKRWKLKEGREEADLLRLVRQQIEPHYKRLSDAVRLGLWRVQDTRSYLALQYWRSHVDWEAATQSPSYAGWWNQYEPILERWDEMMDFEAECNADELLFEDDK
jgi:hypothetical protein